MSWDLYKCHGICIDLPKFIWQNTKYILCLARKQDVLFLLKPIWYLSPRILIELSYIHGVYFKQND